MRVTNYSPFFKKIFAGSSLIWILAASGCGSHDSEPTATPTPSPVASPSPLVQAIEPAPILASISWKSTDPKTSRDRAVSRPRRLTSRGGGNLFQADEEIILPSRIPNRIRISVDLPSDFMSPNAEARVEARVLSDALPAHVLKAALSKEKSDSTFSIGLADIDQILPGDREEKAVITIRLIDLERNAIPLVIRLTLATPPSRLEIHQFKPQELPASEPPLPDGVKILRSRISRWDLLQVVTVKNNSTETLRAESPAILTGRLWTHFHRVTVDQQPCRYTRQDSQWDEVLASEFYLLPIDSDLPARFSSILSERIAENQLRISLTPGQERVFGIYGAGGKLPELIDQGPLRATLQPQSVVSGCHSVCGNPRTEMYGWNANRATYHWDREGFPGSSRACSKAQCIEWIQNPPYTPDLCSECAVWELGNGTAPWDYDRRYCWGDGPGNPWGRPPMEHWHVQKFTENVNAGLETAPVILELAEDSQQARLSFETPAGKESSEDTSRAVPLLKARTVQFE